MIRSYAIYFLLLLPLAAAGQTDSIPAPIRQIAACRHEVLQAFFQNNQADAGFWLDSLQRLDDNIFLATQWDERWLLYFWTNNYGALFQEVTHFTNAWEETTMYKIQPPADSLFYWLDNQLYTDREPLFGQISQSMLSTEEREFADLLLNYLLRLNTEGPEAQAYDERLDAFLHQFPNSRFAHFIRSRMYNTPPPGNWALGIDVLFLQGNWSGMLDRNLHTCYGGDFGLGYWQNRWNFYLRVPIGVQKLAQPIEEKGFTWEKKESSTYFGLELEAGYDIYNRSRLRIMPTVGGGYSNIHPPTGNADNPNPDYYDNFIFHSGHFTTALQVDLKFNPGKTNVATTYHGIRFRLGARWINFGKQNPALKGNMFFFAVGYTIFGRQPQAQ